jgi:hypothetical protein
LKQTEIATLVISDAHVGKRTPSYNPEIFEKRMLKLSERLYRVRQLLGEYDFKEIVVCMLGDIVDGTCIYPTQANHQTETRVTQQAFNVTKSLSSFLVEQAEVWNNVRVVTVPGNHGRTSGAEADNWDLVMYELLRSANNDKRITISEQSDSDPFLHVTNIWDHGLLLFHGHAIKQYASIPWYGIQQRFLRWATSQNLPHWDVGCIGHFHTCGFWQFNRLSLFCTGTMVSDDEWALQSLGADSSNSWWLFGSSPKRATTWMFRMELTEK